jgi:acylphosphatase
MAVTRRLRIHGRVQGVFFRNWSRDEALGLGLAGWVRNRRDGSVEMLLSGPADKVAAMIERCREGPPHAEVERIEVEQTTESVASAFEKRPTV